MTEEVREWWEATAEYFQDEIDMGVGVDWTGPWAPDVDLLGDVGGSEILELGCGGGQCAVALAERGATVTGIDLSAAQLSHARDLAADCGVDVEFLRGDVTDLGMFADASFDAGRQVTGHEGMAIDQVTYRHTVSGVHNTLRDAGFEVERLLEPGTDDPDAYGSGPWGEHVPALLILSDVTS